MSGWRSVNLLSNEYAAAAADDDDDDDDISYNIKFTPKTFRTVYSKTVLVKLS